MLNFLFLKTHLSRDLNYSRNIKPTSKWTMSLFLV